MVDFWEIIGHAVTDDNFRNSLYDTFKQSKASPNPDETNTFACMFDVNDYENARKLVIGKMSFPSLMSLGEWLVVSILHSDSRAKLDNVATATQKQLKNYNSGASLFYQTLGAGVVDSGFRDEFNQGKEGAFGVNLSVPDRNALAPVLADPAFGLSSDEFHAIPWGNTCKDMVIQSQNEPYAHAVEEVFQAQGAASAPAKNVPAVQGLAAVPPKP